MQIVADLHTHTVASTHAYSTVAEMARGATAPPTRTGRTSGIFPIWTSCRARSTVLP